MDENTTLHLPEDIIYIILARLPARFLINHGRFVCKTWSDIIRDPKFAKTHALHSKFDLFFQFSPMHNLARLAEINEDQTEVKLFHRIFARNHIWGSSGGILLLKSNDHDRCLSVVNPVTCQISKLPTLPGHCFFADIAYMPLTGEIKVICKLSDNLCVLTVGSNMAWRMMNVNPNLPLHFEHYGSPLFSLDGVLYYSAHNYMDGKMKLFAVDLRDESVHSINLPCQRVSRSCVILSTGKRLLLVCLPLSITQKVATTWKLKDFMKSEWVEGERVEIKDNFGLQFCTDTRWPENLEVLLYCSRALDGHFVKKMKEEELIAAYRCRQGERGGPWNVGQPESYIFFAHQNTLVSW